MIQILLIEDDAIDASWTSAFLEKAYAPELALRRAHSVDAAIDVLRTTVVDVILLAVHPELEAWNQDIVRLDTERPFTPIVIMAAEGGDNAATDAFAAGAVEFLVKGQITINWIKRAINYAIHRKHLSDLIRKAENLHLGIINLSADAIVSVNADYRILLFSVAAEAMFGYSANEVLGRSLTMLMPGPVRDQHDGHIRGFAAEAVSARRMNERGTELMGLRRNGEIFSAEISISKLATPDGLVFTSVIRDTSERRRVEGHLRDLAMTDPLTGIANRRSFLDAIEQERTRSRRYGHPVSVLLIDIDHFKSINDSFGHAAGDQALLRVTIACKEILRGNDMLGRLGGDEFVALLPETDEGHAHHLAQRLVEHIASINVPYAEHLLRLTISIGCSTIGDKDATVDVVLERADAALREAKRRGRNHALAWTPTFATQQDQPPGSG